MALSLLRTPATLGGVDSTFILSGGVSVTLTCVPDEPVVWELKREFTFIVKTQLRRGEQRGWKEDVGKGNKVTQKEKKAGANGSLRPSLAGFLT